MVTGNWNLVYPLSLSEDLVFERNLPKRAQNLFCSTWFKEPFVKSCTCRKQPCDFHPLQKMTLLWVEIQISDRDRKMFTRKKKSKKLEQKTQLLKCFFKWFVCEIEWLRWASVVVTTGRRRHHWIKVPVKQRNCHKAENSNKFQQKVLYLFTDLSKLNR